jgi:uncharacterized membrane protein
MVLPTGFGFPPLPYAIGLIVGTVGIGLTLARLDPHLDERIVVALAPWMAIGGTLSAIGQFPFAGVVDPLVGTPAVYLTTFILLAATWSTLTALGTRTENSETVPKRLGMVGVGGLVLIGGPTVVAIADSGSVDATWSLASVAGSVIVAAATVGGLSRFRPSLATRPAIVTVVFAHAFDGVSTAIGTDILGVGERSPVPRTIMEFAAELPTAPVLGSGWLFVLVKLAVALAVVVLMEPYLNDEPGEASLLLSVVTAVGLGPATNNVVLFLAA